MLRIPKPRQKKTALIFYTAFLLKSTYYQKKKNQIYTKIVTSVQWSFFFLTSRPAATAAAAKSLQSCPTLCDPIDGLLPGSPVPGILQARILEWVAISLSDA